MDAWLAIKLPTRLKRTTNLCYTLCEMNTKAPRVKYTTITLLRFPQINSVQHHAIITDDTSPVVLSRLLFANIKRLSIPFYRVDLFQ